MIANVIEKSFQGGGAARTSDQAAVEPHRHPGSVLTSMIKRVDVAVYNCMKSAKEGSWQAGSRVLGLKEDGVGYSLDDDNKSLVTDDMKRQVEAAKARIVAGELQVQPYKQ